MKKVFISIFMAALTLSAYAAETARVTIQLTSTNATYGNDELELKENSDRNATYESGYDAEKMMSQANKHSVLLYAFVGDQPCSTVATDDLDGTVIGFTTNKYDTDYKLVFSNVSGRELKLYDLVLNTETVITNSLEYSFSATEGRVAVNDRFVINYVAPTCTTVRNNLEVNRYYTICLPQDVVSFNGASFWSMSKRGEGVAFLEEEVAPLAAGQPYIFQAEAEELCVTFGNAVPADVAGAAGALVGTFAAMNQAALDAAATNASSDIYLLFNNELWLVNGQSGNSLAANHAYVVYNELVPANQPNPAPGRRVRAIPMREDSATGVENINASAAPAKTIIDGKMYILRGEQMFDATGRMVK
jgi:hypothetical protein